MYDNLKKKYGQNFLIDKNILNKIANLIPQNYLKILEIGPGNGLLTSFIMTKNPENLTIIEIDKDLIEILKNKFLKNNKLVIINLDFLKFNLNIQFDLIISNLPYYISSQILVKIITSNFRPKTMIFMFQKEAANKIIENKLNSLNSLVKSFYKCKKEFNVSNSCFKPIPKVESSVVTFEKLDCPLLLNSEIERFIEFKRRVFSKKRKQLKSILKLNDKLKKIEYLNKRAEELEINQLIEIFKQY